jgi:hypothetical protein
VTLGEESALVVFEDHGIVLEGHALRPDGEVPAPVRPDACRLGGASLRNPLITCGIFRAASCPRHAIAAFESALYLTQSG